MQWSWQQVVFILGACGVIILAQKYAPGVAAAVIGILTTAIGLVFRSPVVNPPPKVQS